MIVVIENNSLKNISESTDIALSKYGSFASFLVQEADDEPAPRRNMKVIDIKNRTRTDYSAGSDDLNMPEEEPPAEEPPMEEPAPAPEPAPEPVPEEPPPATDDPGNEEDFSAGSDDLATGGDEPPAEDPGGGDATIEPDDGTGEGDGPAEGEDYSAGSDELAAGGAEDVPPPEDQGQTDDGGQGGGNTDLDLDQGRKLVLFQDYKNLYNNIDDFIEKLDQLPRTDPSENTIFKKCSKYLRRLKDMLYDWMVLRFQTKSYFQSQYFFQQAVVSCQLVVNTINKLAIIKAKKSK